MPINKNSIIKRKLFSYSSQKGMTIVELLVAIAVSAALVTGVFFVYINVIKGFKKHTQRVEGVVSMVVAKQRIDAAVLGMRTIKSLSTFRIEFVRNDGTVHTLIFDKKKLLYDGKILIDYLASFSSEVVNTGGRDPVYLWEGVFLTGAWIGGGCAIKDF